MDPHITSISPAEVTQNWSGTLQIIGAGFNERSAAMIEARFPTTTYVSPTILEAAIESADTAVLGPKAIQVHQLDTGSLSNEIFLLVSPP